MKFNIREIIYIQKGSFNYNEYLKIDVQDFKNVVKYSINEQSKIFELEDDKINIFLESLLRTVASWQKKYIVNNVVDGTIWQLKLIYKSGFEKNYYGENLFPNNFNNFNQLKKQLLM